jgi:mannan endo-1,4-beta-mannosidase
MTPRDTGSAPRWTSGPRATRNKKYVCFVIFAVVAIGAVLTIAVVRPWTGNSVDPDHSVRYLGVYEPGAPATYAGVEQFAKAIGRQPNLVSYYSSWPNLEPFQVGFATLAAKHGATTVVQIEPRNVSLISIASGQYDAYLRSYAAAVKAFGAKVVLSFGHEMNGNWYSWGNRHSSPKAFVAAWRHIVTVFRAAGAENVIWLWTVNIIDNNVPIPDPAPWWPGRSYVTWVGIDGYYYSPSQTFSQVFGPTIVDVRMLTGDPILIAETGVSPTAYQAAKITDLFAGIQAYGLLGFMWFDADVPSASNGVPQDWRLDRAALASFRRDATAFMRSPLTPVSAQQDPSPGSFQMEDLVSRRP